MGKNLTYKDTLYKVEENLDESRRLILELLLTDTLSQSERDCLTKVSLDLCDITDRIIDGRSL